MTSFDEKAEEFRTALQYQPKATDTAKPFG
jgi:hypothetical protein